MADEIIEFSIPLDDDGFVSLQCPYCNETFKITGGLANEENISQLCCPYCGLFKEPNSFLTSDVIEQARILAYNNMVKILNKGLKKMESSFKNNKCMTFKKGKDIEQNEEKELIEPNNLQLLKVKCCNTEIKIFITNSVAYCVCGGFVDADRD